MGRVLETAEKLWTGALRADDHPPYTPLLELEPIADGVAFLSSFANVTAIETVEGLVLFDVGSGPFSGPNFAALRRWSKERVHTAVFTHGHLDHVMGIDRFDHEAKDKTWPRIRVVAHEAVPARFERYAMTPGYNACINSRQFQLPVTWPTSYRTPDLLYAKELRLAVGGIAIELHHARGETDDHTWAWVPSKKLLCTGDLFIWCCPNAGNPQKAQRYPREWARALRTMATLGAEVLAPGHGVPIVGADRVRLALSETAEILEYIHDTTLEAMNRGLRLEEVIQLVQVPERLLQRPYLTPVYDEPEFIVRNLWRQYGGWWDGDPSHLKPATPSHLAKELATLAGGAKILADRAKALLDAGDLPLACHLAELAAQAAPDDADIQKTRADVYHARARRERSLIARGIYAAAANEPPKA